MAEIAAKTRDSNLLPTVKKRWRAWLRAVHRDFGYLAIGFTVIYAVSGIAQNHIEDWGEVSYRNYEKTIQIAAVSDDASDEVAIKTVADAADLGAPTSSFRAGDEVRLEYANGAKATAIGTELTIQGRERRAFIGAANWLHTARNKSGWRYVADVYAALLLYLAISGIFMIKGRLGLKWRGAVLISIGVAVPVSAVMFSGPDARAKQTAPAQVSPATAKDDGGIKFLPPDQQP
ncbi:MAG TPA: PepSY-associated TM helix domain-containing protein [Kofleriaceae bacterium]